MSTGFPEHPLGLGKLRRPSGPGLGGLSLDWKGQTLFSQHRPPKPNMANPSGRAERDVGGRMRKSHPPGGPDFCVCPWGMWNRGPRWSSPGSKEPVCVWVAPWAARHWDQHCWGQVLLRVRLKAGPDGRSLNRQKCRGMARTQSRGWPRGLSLPAPCGLHLGLSLRLAGGRTTPPGASELGSTSPVSRLAPCVQLLVSIHPPTAPEGPSSREGCDLVLLVPYCPLGDGPRG